MNICLINTPSLKKRPVTRSMAGGLGFDSSESMILPPLDLAILAKRLKDTGHQVDLIDADPLGYDENDILKELKINTYNWIIATASLPTLKNDCLFISSLRKFGKIAVKTWIKEPEILGQILKDTEADIIIHDECDLHIEQILEGTSDKGTAFFKNNELVIKNSEPIKDIDKIPYAARELLPNKVYIYPLLGEGVTTMQTSRGCPFPCSYYCPYPLVEGKLWRTQSPERVYEEIDSIVNRFSIRKILFRDATFTLDKGRIHSLCEMIIKNRLPIEWWCETRVDCLDTQLIEKMQEAGCRGMNIGIETGDEALMARQAKKGLTLERLRWLKDEAKRLGLKLHFLLSIGLPQETKKSIVETYELIQKFEPESLGITVITPYPGTPLYKDAVRNGWIESYNWKDYGGHQIVMRTDNLSRSDIAAAMTFLWKGYAILKTKPTAGNDRIDQIKEDAYRELLVWACNLQLKNQRYALLRYYIKRCLYRIYPYITKWIPPFIKSRLILFKRYIDRNL